MYENKIYAQVLASYIIEMVREIFGSKFCIFFIRENPCIFSS